MKYLLFVLGKIQQFLVLFLFLAVQMGCSTKSSSVLDAHGDIRYNRLTKTLLTEEFAASLSVPAKRRALEAEYRALENNRSGEPEFWHHSNVENGKVIPYPPYQVGSSHCRRYIHSITINGVLRQASGTACRDDKGIWTPLM